MKKVKNNLFRKFNDSVLTQESLMFIEGGVGGPGSSSTGDTDCTSRGGSGSDCGDISTDGSYDSDPTGSDSDGCISSSGGKLATALFTIAIN